MLDFRTIKRGIKYLARTGDFKSATDYLKITNTLSKILHTDKSQIQSLFGELNESGIMQYLDSTLGSLKGNPTGALLNPAGTKILYCVTRVLKPDIVIETGVSSGASSSIILKALEKNKSGRLISIDLPPSSSDTGEWIEEVKKPGWVVPKELTQRWQIYLGKSSELLPKVLRDLEEIDVFFHDSDHSYENMMFEFNTVYEKIRQNGIILSDNAVNFHTAFRDFAKNKKATDWKTLSDFGILLK